LFLVMCFVSVNFLVYYLLNTAVNLTAYICGIFQSYILMACRVCTLYILSLFTLGFRMTQDGH